MFADSDDPDDPDRLARKDAVRFLGRRAAIWAVPLILLGLLLAALGIPWWISLGVVVITLVIVVFEVDF